MAPFLKWPGGKSKIVDKIISALPPGERLVEPFVGSGAVFLNANYKECEVFDVNEDLINLYKEVQSSGGEFISYAASLFTKENNTPEKYLELREEFNTSADITRKSAIFVYMNRHGFNGLCRYNSKGAFNVAYGKRTNPLFPLEYMRAFHEKSKSVTFGVSDFRNTLANVKPGSVVYCDPPYTPPPTATSFTAYAKSPFTETDQKDLAKCASQLAERGIPVIISNHDTEFTRELYAGAKIISFDVRRYISRGANSLAAEMLAIY